MDKFNTQDDPEPFGDEQTIDDSYRGYSVTFGEFSGDNSPDVATGLPRGPISKMHKGEVRIYKWP